MFNFIKNLFETKPIHEDHKPPVRFYEGGFCDIRSCEDCGLIGSSWDLFPTDPCSKCGGKTRDSAPRKWSEINGVRQWVSRGYNEDNK